MKRIAIHVMKSTDALDAFLTAWHAAEAGGEVTPRLTFVSLRDRPAPTQGWGRERQGADPGRY